MDFGVESLIIFLAFILPGFLTSRLISVKIPAIGRQPSPFQETSQSLLRSVYIQLFTIPIVLGTVRYFLVSLNPDALQQIYLRGIYEYANGRPFLTLFILLGWLLLAFILAIFFGYKWDPLDYILSTLVTKTGTVTEDPYFMLRQIVVEKRKRGDDYVQLWLQARLKNGYTYRGELAFVSFKEDGKSRELMLANVKFFPYPVQAKDAPNMEPKHYHFVFLDINNCESIEAIISNIAP